MHKIKFFSFFLVIFVSVATIAKAQPSYVSADSVSYHWPTEASRFLSSTFAETRSAHLHAGIDIRTWGREGYKVFATRDGVVYRVGTGPSGYGNVIYLKHDDGSFSVYAHLNRFETGLQAFTDSLRLIDFTTKIDEHIEEQGIRYKKGDVIGYTGSTGVGPPHFHFELRTPDFKPFNPLLTNLRVEDTLPPVFTQLAIEFLNSETLHLEGHKIVPVSSLNDSPVRFGEVRVSGPVGISVNVHDRANRTPNVYAVHQLIMIHEADTLFHSVADQFSYEHSGHMFLDRSYPILAQTRRGFQRLYVVGGNNLPFYKTLQNKGVLHFNKGKYQIRIIASDIYGNQKEGLLTLNFDGETSPSPITHVPAYPQRKKQPGEISEPDELTSDFSLYASAEESSVFTKDYRIEPPARRASFGTALITPGENFTFETPTRDLWLQFPKDAVYDTLDLKIDITHHKKTVDFEFEPNRLPIQAPVYFSYKLPESLKQNDKLALFSHDQYRDRLFFLNSDNSNGFIRAELNEISNLRILEDNMAPWVGQPRLTRNLGGNYVIEIPAKDGMTKIDYENSIITVNGQRGIAEYDPETHLLIYYHPDFVPQKNNEVTFTILDGVGNKTQRTSTIPYLP